MAHSSNRLARELLTLLNDLNTPADTMRTEFSRFLESTDAQATLEAIQGLSSIGPHSAQSLAVIIPLLTASVRELLEECRDLPDAGAAVVHFTGEALSSGGVRSLLAARIDFLAALLACEEAELKKEHLEIFSTEGMKSQNRFVREAALLGTVSLVNSRWDAMVSLESREPALDAIVEAIAMGMDDKWNQVRFAGCKLCRAVVEKKMYNASTHLELLVPRMLLVRHYDAEGIQNFSLQTWLGFVQGEAPTVDALQVTGKAVARKFLPQIFRLIQQLVLPVDHGHGPGHDHEHCHTEGAGADERASGAALLLLYEMLEKVVTDETFSVQYGRVAMEMAVAGISASAWSVRSVGLQVLPPILRKCEERFPSAIHAFQAELIAELKLSVVDQIPGIRKDSAIVASQLADSLGGKGGWVEYARQLIADGLAVGGTPADADDSGEPVNRPMFSCCSFGGSSQRKGGSVLERLDGGLRLYMALDKSTRDVLGEEEKMMLRKIKETRPQLAKLVDEVLTASQVV